MTNEPPLPLQLENLAHYQALSPEEPVNRFAPTLPLKVGGRCTGAIGLPATGRRGRGSSARRS